MRVGVYIAVRWHLWSLRDVVWSSAIISGVGLLCAFGVLAADDH